MSARAGKSWALRAVGLTLLLLALGFALGVLLSPDEDSRATVPEPGVLTGDDFALAAPEEWTPVDEVEFPFAEAAGADYVGASIVGKDESTWLMAYSFPFEETTLPQPDQLDGYAAILDLAFDRAVRRLPQGRLTSPTSPETVGGLPAVRVDLAYRNDEGREVALRMTQLLAGERGYVIVTQSGSRNARAIDAVHDRALASLEIAGG